ncbi:hypothetical protein AGABI1DRAFT_115446 [Agaricus bisporus var. burnettii JB137-S8]|uniref:Phosphoribulokinase/uridine kinase domain-containing protein n=1 Tax=Agaricus bisporus var. burnettii (strain JB137-S8 / ATCC MYA-4627 / FGSC 10392) TaxID=597362 RepID=K5XQD5_AGABU|nr:uncharacterized protein AGABI1DRAFT_115446 [Agaricus bisporus var. burnettii JB137-S8]EKM77005.1 hypothetical protein AGABI1DRAFT_115446 [Agaricus bisporus var. burnettii JB137-S8]
MDAIAAELAAQLLYNLNQIPAHKRLLVGIAGIPGAGKTVFAHKLISALAAQPAVLIGLDGWHYTRAELAAMPDPQLARNKRGAHWTFDGSSYVAFMRSLTEDITPFTPIITAPSFDHAIKDPEPHAVAIHPHHRIVIIEGLYTFLSITPWAEASKLLDERWFVQTDIDKVIERIVKRHVVTGVAKDEEEAIWRANENDMPNGRFLMENMLEPTRVITSIDDTSLTPL